MHAAIVAICSSGAEKVRCYSVETSKALIFNVHCRTVDFHSRLVDKIHERDIDLADVVCAQLVLVLDAEDQLLGVVTDGDAEELVPLRTQIVVDHLQLRAREKEISDDEEINKRRMKTQQQSRIRMRIATGTAATPGKYKNKSNDVP